MRLNYYTHEKLCAILKAFHENDSRLCGTLIQQFIEEHNGRVDFTAKCSPVEILGYLWLLVSTKEGPK